MAQTTTLPKNRDFFADQKVKAEVEILQISKTAKTYAGKYAPAPSVIVDNVTIKIGAEPSEATLSVPVDLVNKSPQRVRGHKTYVIKAGRLFPLGSDAVRLGYYSKVKIYYRDGRSTSLGQRHLLFVGYVSKARFTRKGKSSSIFNVHLKDARWLMQKAPVMGAMFFDAPSGLKFDLTQDGDDFTTFIKNASHISFNQGTHPNMWYDPYDEQWWKRPRFTESDYNRTDPDGLYIPDEEIEKANLAKVNFPVARRWVSGAVFNYCANLVNCSSEARDEDLTGAESGSSPMWEDPAAITADDVPVSLRGEVDVPILQPAPANSNNMAADFFQPRALVGPVAQSGIQTAVSSVGEYSPWGRPINEILQDLCYRTGNYALAPTYSEEGTGRLVLHVIRTTLAFAQDKTVPLGLGSTEPLVVYVAGNEIGRLRPDVDAFNWEFSADNLFNVQTTRGGLNWAQMTFLTMGTETSIDVTGQFHPKYNPAGAKEHRPRTIFAALEPGWLGSHAKEWAENLATTPQGNNADLFPDVYRTFLLSPQIRWPDMWGTILNEAGTAQALGFRRNFRNVRQMMATNITSFYQLVLGAFRRRREKLPIFAMRAFRGIRTDSDGNTRYGDATTEATAAQLGNGPVGLSDFFLVQSPAEPIADDGRVGIRFGPGARALFSYPFEAGDNGKSKSPLTWNGLITEGDARSYEIMLTISVPSDEELFEFLAQTSDGIAIRQHGFRAERVQDAGSEFQNEQAINSVIHLPEVGGDVLKVDPPNISPRRVYTNGEAEISARSIMGANKFFKPDVDGTFEFLGIMPQIQAGQHLEKIVEISDAQGATRDIPLNVLVSSVVHDFSDIQKTVIEFGSIR